MKLLTQTLSLRTLSLWTWQSTINTYFIRGFSTCAMVFGLLLSTSVINIPSQYVYAQTLDTIAAIVNDDLIMHSELERQIATEKQQRQAQNLVALDESALETQVLEAIITETIQVQRAAEQNIKISETMLNSAIANIARNNNLTLPQLQQAVINNGEQISTFRERIKQEITIQEVRNVEINRRITITEAEVDRFLASNNGQSFAEPEYLLAHILITLSPNEPDRTQRTLQEIADAFDAGEAFTDVAIAHSDADNAPQGGVLGWRKASQLPAIFSEVLPTLSNGDISDPISNNRGTHLFQVLDIRGAITATSEQTRARHILILPNDIRNAEATKNLAQDIYQNLQNGADFAELASAYSDDKKTALEGGDMGWLAAKQLPNFMQQQLDKLPASEFSPPFQGPTGWHILQADERRTQHIGEQLIRQQARKHLFDQKFSGELENWLNELRNQAYVDIR